MEGTLNQTITFAKIKMKYFSSWHLFNRIIKRNLRNNFNVFAKIIYLSFNFIHFLFYLQMNLVGGSAILRIFIYKVTVNPHYVLITIKKYVWHTFCDSSYNYFVPIYPSGMPLWHNRRLLLIRHQQSKGTILPLNSNFKLVYTL